MNKPWICALVALLAFACGDEDETIVVDGGLDAGVADGGGQTVDGGLDGGFDGGLDAGEAFDAGGDAGFDAAMDAQVDAQVDAEADAAVDGGLDGGIDAGPDCIRLPGDADPALELMLELSTTSPQWSRPTVGEGATTCGPVETESFYYEELRFCSDHASELVCILTMDGATREVGTLEDPFLVVYEGDGIPADATACLAANDDGPGETLDSEVEVTVRMGDRLTVVATSFDDTTGGGEGAVGEGTFVLTVACFNLVLD